MLRAWYLGRYLFTCDVVLAIIAAALFALLAFRDMGPIMELVCKDGTALYGAFLAALTALLGFTIAAIAIIAALVTGDAFKELRKSDEYQNFWGAFTWSIRALAIGSVLSLLALFAGRYDGFQFWTLVVVVWGIALAASSLLRSGRTLEVVLKKTRHLGEPEVETQNTYDKVQVEPHSREEMPPPRPE
jgi:MFS family permease